jgi:subtilisin family serine protease
MDTIQQIRLHSLMSASKGKSDVTIGLIDGPVDFSHPDFRDLKMETVNDEHDVGGCRNVSSIACQHGTFVAGILSSNRGSLAPSICPGCKIILRPIFEETFSIKLSMPKSNKDGNNNNNKSTYGIPISNPEELSKAIIETIDYGAKIINLSLGLSSSSLITYSNLMDAYDYARKHEVILVVAAGNQGNIGFTSLLNHPWVIPVAACNQNGVLSIASNYGPTISKQGLMAPGVDITSTLAGGGYATLSGNSLAAPFVTGTIALLWSIFPDASAAKIIQSIVPSYNTRLNRSIIPKILDAEQAYERLKSILM